MHNVYAPTPVGTGFDPDELADGAGGMFGDWITSDDGAPAFEVAPGVTEGWHLVGAPGLLATVDPMGRTSLYATARGFVRLADRDGEWLLDGATPVGLRTRYLEGSVEWRGGAPGGATVVRRLTAASECASLHLEIENRGDTTVVVEERWALHPRPLLVGPLMSRAVPPPRSFGPLRRARWRALFAATTAVRGLVEAIRDRVAATMTSSPTVVDGSLRFVPRHPARPATVPRWVDRSLPVLEVRADGRTPGGPPQWSTTGFTIDIPPGTGARFVVELVDDPSPTGPAGQHPKRSDPESTASSPRPADAAPGVEIDLGPGPGTVLAREAHWHLAQLRGLRVPDACFGHTYVSQGSAYAFVHGVQGAPRDYAISAVALSVLDPPTARDLVLFIARMCRPGGAMHYAHTGAGRCTSGGIHESPTDLPLFWLWAVTDYVWATGDTALLDTVVPFAPGHRHPATTVRDRVVQASRYLRDGVGAGPHGMLRVGSGDWADPISLMVRHRRDFHRHGESGFNTGFAAYVLPRAAVLVGSDHPEVAAEMRDLAATCRQALDAAWTGRWFLRGWDGRGGPIGEHHLFLDGQVWALIAGIGDESRRATLTAQIRRRCDDPSPIGPTILDRPHRVRLDLLAPGWDCNGGVWAAISALTAWAYGTVDPDLAWRCLLKQSLAAHSVAYPSTWFGTWSGPDAYNSHFGEQAGGTFVHPATPMAEYPTMNSNAHAGPLLGLLKVLGVEATPAGLGVRGPGPHAAAPTAGSARPRWHIETAERTLSGTLPT